MLACLLVVHELKYNLAKLGSVFTIDHHKSKQRFDKGYFFLCTDEMCQIRQPMSQ